MPASSTNDPAVADEALTAEEGDAEVRRKDQFPIVGIGASAGGVEALEGFFKGLPPQPDCAIVIVTHLSPERESLLHEIISRYTELPVHVANDAMKVEINSVYVLPADAILSIERRLLHIRRNGSRRERKPIDIFFASLALDVGELAVGIVMSGGDGDGTLGVKAIKERGGLTLAQTRDGYGPQHPDMPTSAISAGFVDLAVPAEAMGRKLADFAHGQRVLDGPLARDADGQTVEEVMPEIYGILRTQIGHDFSGYKAKTFMRRVQRRMQVTQFDTVDAYVEQLRQKPGEVGALFRDLLINVTNFFRDEDAFASLAAEVIPKLFEGRGADDTVRVWIPGCSTGEEVFSIAILMREHMDSRTALPRVQLFATDIDERALSVARAARYPSGLLDSVSAERRERFFVGDGGSYVVSKNVREMCIFSPHSVIRDPPFSRVDLVSCRNPLIYFGIDVQNQVIPTFHYALKTGGYLFLGSAENVSQFNDLFEPIEKKHRIFRRRSDVGGAIRLPLILGALKSSDGGERAQRRQALSGTGFRSMVDDQVMERFAPPHVVVNGDGDAVYFSHKTGTYLEPPAGAPTRQLLNMARKDLRLDLRAAFREAVENGRGATRDGIAMESEGGTRSLSITVEPLQGRDTGERLYLVLFVNQGLAVSGNETSDPAQSVRDGVAGVDHELRETRPPAIDDRGIRDGARGTEILQRGAGLGQRGDAVDQ